MEDHEIASALSALPPALAIELLSDLANLRGGPDNITILIAKVLPGADTSKLQPSDPLVVSESRSPTPSSPLTFVMWILLGLCLLLGGVSYAMGQTFWFWVLLGVGAMPGLFILIDFLRTMDTGGVTLSGGRRLGEGPYSDTAAAPIGEFANHMRDAIRTSRQAAEEKGWPVDWSEFEQTMTAADQLLAAGEAREGLEQLVSASRFLVKQCQLYMRPQAV
ncbi:MAG: hypothetical protein AAGA95_21485 [Pseudomonadota bacterium]